MVKKHFCRALKDGDEVHVVYDRNDNIIKFSLNGDQLEDVDAANIERCCEMFLGIHDSGGASTEVDIL